MICPYCDHKNKDGVGVCEKCKAALPNKKNTKAEKEAK